MLKIESLSRPVYAEIHRDRLLSNLQYLKSKTPHPFFCPMLKANAYGHGDQQIANLFEEVGVKCIGVATIEEAIHIRNGGYTEQILVFSPTYEACTKEIVEHRITPVLAHSSHLQQLKYLPSSIAIHVKINTGMNRMGFQVEEIQEALTTCKQKGWKIEGVLTHLLKASDIRNKTSETKKQIQKFSNLQKKYFQNVPIQHVYNSEALLNVKNPIYGARPGIALFGYSECEDKNLSPVMEVKAKIVTTRTLKKGEGVSYGATWRAKKTSIIGVLPIGYADGLSRAYSGKYTFLFGNHKVKQIGTICMDYTMVDLTDVKEQPQVGSLLSIFSAKKNNTANDIAKQQKTIPYEVLTSVGARIPRFFVD